MAVGLAVRG